MKKLIKNISILFFLLLSTLLIIWFMPGSYPHDLAALVNKKETLREAKPPRLIFTGGSDILTLKSELVERELHYPVINMGLWGGLSLERNLEEIEPYIAKGDVIVLTLEYAAALDPDYMKYINTNEESKRFFFLMSPNRHIQKFLHQGKYFIILKRVIELSQLKVRSFIRNLLTLQFSELFANGLPKYYSKFDRHGDRNTPYRIIRPLNESGKIFKDPQPDKYLFLNKFYEKASKKSAKVIFYFSHFPEEEYNLNKEKIMKYYEILRGSLKIPIVNTPRDFVYPRKYFADTIYHLNEKGERVRSRQMIIMLKKVLKKIHE